MNPTCCLYDAESDPAQPWRIFRSPRQILNGTRVADIAGCLREVEAETEAGRFAVGCIAYEAAPAFDLALVTHPPGPGPLLWFGIFDACERAAELPSDSAQRPGDEFAFPHDNRETEGHSENPPASASANPWRLALGPENYHQVIDRIKDYIASGDTYQVNFTQRLQGTVGGEPFDWFRAVCGDCPPPYAAWIDTGAHAICSFSPELFFALKGERITCRPMKGTSSRGRTPQEDEAHAAALASSAKDRAENAMIVDMIRNDLGRIAHPGSVQTVQPFSIERHPTVLQMVSTVQATTDASLPGIFAALFPCASITGAPKVRTMQIIRELESSPRGLYTGCIGYVAPQRKARFSVAIRTAVVEKRTGAAVYGTGGGIVWDSDAGREYAECALKTRVLTERRPPFDLLETLLWKRGRYWLLQEHLERLCASAAYFGFGFSEGAVRECLAEAAKSAPERLRVRLTLSRDGTIGVAGVPVERGPRRVWRVRWSDEPVDPEDIFLYHKTTRRAVYERARRHMNGCDDVLLWNDRDELTESTIANVAVQLKGRLWTPPVESGLLAGTLRARLVKRGILRERLIRRTELAEAEGLWLLNSVRGWIPAELIPTSPRTAAS